MDLTTAATPDDALIAAQLLAVNPRGLRGASVRALSGPERDRFIDTLRHLLPDSAPFLKVPVTVGFDRLLGGLDFARRPTISVFRLRNRFAMLADRNRIDSGEEA